MQGLDWVYNASLSLLTVNRPMHLRDRKLTTCKLVCIQTMGNGGSEGTEGITFHLYISPKDRVNFVEPYLDN